MRRTLPPLQNHGFYMPRMLLHVILVFGSSRRRHTRYWRDWRSDVCSSDLHDYLGEALISLEAIQESGLPSIVTFASTDDVTIDAYEFDEACMQLEARGADVVGLNCSRGPQTMLPILERIRAAVDCHVAAQPVPYRTTPAQPHFEALKDAEGTRGFPIALEPFLCTRFEMAEIGRASCRERV